MPDADLKIINRLFYTPHAEAGWDGGDAPAGEYYWLMRYEGKSGKTGTDKGWVHLLK